MDDEMFLGMTSSSSPMMKNNGSSVISSSNTISQQTFTSSAPQSFTTSQSFPQQAPMPITLVVDTNGNKDYFKLKIYIFFIVFIVIGLLYVWFRYQNRQKQMAYTGLELPGPELSVKLTNEKKQPLVPHVKKVLFDDSRDDQDYRHNDSNDNYNSTNNQVFMPTTIESDVMVHTIIPEEKPDIVHITGEIPIWETDDPTFDKPETKVNEQTNTVNDYIKAREAMTKDLEQFMAQGLKEMP